MTNVAQRNWMYLIKLFGCFLVFMEFAGYIRGFIIIFFKWAVHKSKIFFFQRSLNFNASPSASFRVLEPTDLLYMSRKLLFIKVGGGKPTCACKACILYYPVPRLTNKVHQKCFEHTQLSPHKANSFKILYPLKKAHIHTCVLTLLYLVLLFMYSLKRYTWVCSLKWSNYSQIYILCTLKIIQIYIFSSYVI